MLPRVLMICILSTVSVCAAAVPAAADGPDRAGLELFESAVRPLLVERCYSCHSARAEKLKGNLRLDSRPGWARGGDRGPAIVPGDPAASLLLRAVRYEDPDLQMPPRRGGPSPPRIRSRRLPRREIEVLERWIALGAPDPRDEELAAPAGPGAASAAEDTFDLAARREAHWAWRAIEDPAPPAVTREAWPSDPLDRFILARLEAAGLEPAPPASRRTWLRRVTFDLIGLPPTPEEVRAFLDDESPDAERGVVRRLLASKRFGEKWAQHWLDLVRYAETRGHEGDFDIPEAWRYRDYVIRALNADVPHDDLLVEHLAGDLVAEPRLDRELRTNESIQGTGFWHLGEATHSPVDIRGDEAERVANQIEVFGKAFLGLTLSCARCHEHKFDAISQEDYYAIFGFLQSSSYQLADVADPPAQRAAAEGLRELRAEYAPRILAAWAELVAGRREFLERALLAAGRALRGEAPAAAPRGSGGAAAGAALDGELLGRWVEALETAERDPGDPLHAFAAVARLPGEPDGAAIAAAASGVLERWRARAGETARAHASLKVVRTVEDGERNYVRTERAAGPEDLVVDFADLLDRWPGDLGDAGEDWITSGHRFGDRPADAGEVVLGAGAGRPIARVVEEAGARGDLLSERLTGMLRTRTFEVTSDTLWYRSSGAAEVFLAVDSHRVVNGPLHGVVKQKLEGGPSPAWRAHDVRDYIGHRVHVEFTPSEGFALGRVRFSAAEPVELFRPNARLAAALDAGPAADRAGFARLWAGALIGAVTDLAAGALGDREERRDAARIANWLLDHEDLFAGAGGERDAVAELHAEYLARRGEVEATIPAPIRALAMLDGSAEREPVHTRGNHRTLAPGGVPRRLLTAFDPSNRELSRRGSGRLELARRLVDPSNPLVSRVIVNRVWHHLFGRGIVPTVDDFGVMGESPSHPLLLDHLATRLTRDGWSLKGLIERLVLSSAYRMSSRPDPRAEQVDPRNVLLHRMRVRRLAAEAIRDAVLAVSGRLDPAMYGPSVRIHITPFMRGNRSPGWSGPMDGDGRRSIYVEVRRNHLSHFLTAFDRPVPFTAIGRRSVSNSPAQSLLLLNDPLVHEMAGRWAERLLAPGEMSDAERVERAWLEAFARPPDRAEREAALAFLGDGSRDAAAGLEAWRDLCHTLMNVKEFIFID